MWRTFNTLRKQVWSKDWVNGLQVQIQVQFFFFLKYLSNTDQLGNEINTTTLKEVCRLLYVPPETCSCDRAHLTPQVSRFDVEDIWENAFRDVQLICAKFCRILPSCMSRTLPANCSQDLVFINKNMITPILVWCFSCPASQVDHANWH